MHEWWLLSWLNDDSSPPSRTPRSVGLGVRLVPELVVSTGLKLYLGVSVV